MIEKQLKERIEMNEQRTLQVKKIYKNFKSCLKDGEDSSV